MAGTAFIASKLPNGLRVKFQDKEVELKGAHASDIIADVGLTEVDADWATAWFEANADYAPVEAGAIFLHKKIQDVKVEAKSREKVKTGLEGLDADNPAPGITQAKA